MAASRSVKAVEAPFMGVPPTMEILVELPPGFGVDEREALADLGLDFAAGSSEIRKPPCWDFLDAAGLVTSAGVGCLCCCCGVGALEEPAWVFLVVGIYSRSASFLEYATPGGGPKSSTLLAVGVCRAGFVFFVRFLFDLGTGSMPVLGVVAAAVSLRRELKSEMNVRASGEVPRRLLKWSTAAALGSVAA